MKTAWIDINDCAGWLAAAVLGCFAAGGAAADWEGAFYSAEPQRNSVVAEEIPASPPTETVAGPTGPLSFGKAWQIPAWSDAESNAGFEDVASGGSDGGINLVNFFSGYRGHHGACGPECYECEPMGGLGHCGAICHRWTGTVDALFLWQNNIASRPLFLSTATLTTAVDADQLQTPVSVGPRFGIFYHIDDCYSIEGNYFIVQSFNGTYQAPSVTDGYASIDLASPLPLVVDGAEVISSGEIQSAEINWRRHAGMITWLAGFRWVEWNGGLNVRSVSGLGEDLVSSFTGNDLYGGQLGADILLWSGWRGLQVNTLGKAGVYYNTAYQGTTASLSTQPPYSGSARSAADQTAFFGELGINGAWWITDRLAWRVGYSFFWLSGVATPAEQLSLVDVTVSPATSSINTEGSVFLQGVTTGIEARW